MRERRRTVRNAFDRWRGLGASNVAPVLVATTARVLIPRSTPTATSGQRGAGRVMSCSTVNATNQRPRSNRTVADRTRASPRLARSWSLTRPILGRIACVGSQRIAPVVNRTDGRAFRRDLNLGNPTGLPFRFPFLESAQFFNARARASRPVLNASFEHSAHHGATVFLTAFQSLRSEYSDHEIDGVRSSPAIP